MSRSGRKTLRMIRIGPVQMFSRWQIREFFQMFGAQRFGNDMRAIEPFAEIDQFAAMGAKRGVLACKPVA